MSQKLPKNNNLLSNARDLRKNMTPQERKLWYDFLRTYPVKIYKQKIIANYIVDFYCDSAKLVIELDGSQHYEEEAIAYDANRTEVFESYGLKVLRYTNLEIVKQFDAVCQEIDGEIQNRRK